MAQGCAEVAIRHAWNAGAVCLKAKEILPRGEFGSWLEENSKERGIVTLYKWMKLAKFQLNEILSGQPKGLNDAYIAAGVLPMSEQKQQQERQEQQKPPFVLSFKTKFKNLTEWDEVAARDFLYEFEPVGILAMKLKTEFGL